MDLIFILVEPAVPENIGAACRALKTMGFSELRLINTQSHLNDQARWLAHGSADILENAQLFNSLDEALFDIDFTVGTTAKQRSVKLDYYHPEELKQLLLKKETTINKVAIVFGREESGLTNPELQLCDIAVTIPLKQAYPSINLAQAVMTMTYSLSEFSEKKSTVTNKTSDYTLLKQKTGKLLRQLNLKTSHNLHGRIMERLSTVDSADINLLLSLLNRLERKITDEH